MKQKELADAIGRSVSTVERIERGDASAIGKTRKKRERTQLDVARATGVWIGFLRAEWGEEPAAQKASQPDLLSQLDAEARKSLEAMGAELTWEAIAQEILAVAMRRASEESPSPTTPRQPAPDEVERGLDEIEAEAAERTAGRSRASETQREAG